MEEDDSVPDLSAAEVRRNELTRTGSDSSSVTVDIGRGNVARPSMSWTNAKHNLYLASLEASFVKQLHHSLGLFSSRSEQNTYDPSPSQQLPLDASYCSDQRVNFERSQPYPYSAAGSHSVKESSWMQQFRCSGKHNNKISADLRECSTFCSEEMLSGRKRTFTHQLSTSRQPFVCHESQQDALGNIAEVSDQNFVDEDQQEKSIILSRPKRLKMDAADSSPNVNLS